MPKIESNNLYTVTDCCPIGFRYSIQVYDDFTACYTSPALECILQAFPAR